MPRPHKNIIEYRNYDLPSGFPALVLSGSSWHISDVKSNRLHFHNCLEIGICHSDSGMIEFENKPLPFQAGDVTVISRNIPHTTYSNPGQSSLWSYLFLQPDKLMPPYLRQSLQESEVLEDIAQNICHIFNRADYPQIYFYATHMIEELVACPLNYQVSVRSLCAALMIELMRIHSTHPMYEKDKPAENALVLAPALDYLEENYHQQFPIEQLSELCGLSPTHFRRLFRSIMRCSPLEFLHRTRITRARSLLRGTGQSILEISEVVGYSSLSSFNRHFLQETKLSPSEWRRQMVTIPKQAVSVYSGWMLPEQPTPKSE